MSNRVHDEDGNLIEQWDDESRKYSRFNKDGSVAGTPRDYNDDENADADRLEAAETRLKNEESLKQQLDASLDSLQVITCRKFLMKKATTAEMFNARSSILPW
jgi:hypothetical protein